MIFDEYRYDLLSEQIWEDNYKAPRDSFRTDTWDRLAKGGASVEEAGVSAEVENSFKDILYNDRFVPGGRIISNLEVDDRLGTTLFNCFVHHPRDIGLADPDSLDGIYDMLKAQAKTLKSEGGYGINASWIRPEGSYVRGIGSRTPGVLKFMELWDKSSEIITSGSMKVLGSRKAGEKAKIRKGAQMLVLNIWHPDIEDFIDAKLVEGRLTKFNLSVGVTDGFMEALLQDGDWDLVYPDTTVPEYRTHWNGYLKDWEDLGLPVITYKTVKAAALWDKIVSATYTRNDPGVLFLDVANKLNPVHWCDVILTTNPCGEVPMSTGVCDLGSMNLVTFVKKTPGGEVFDFEAFRDAIAPAIRFLDNINDISRTPLPEYAKAMQQKRRIGLGVMGLGSLHLMLRIPYGSEESKKLTHAIFKTKAEAELLASAKLGQEKGSFPLFDADKYFTSYWWNNLQIDPEVKREIESIGCMRNSHQSMNAPTGNTGIYARNVSGGIEPVFSLGYSRWAIVPAVRKSALITLGMKVCDPSKGEWFETEHFKFAKRGEDQILKGSYEGVNYEVDRNRGLVVESFVEDYGQRYLRETYGDAQVAEWKASGVLKTATDLSVSGHTDILAIAAHYTNMAISKTVNVPNDYPYEDFKGLYLDAWKKGIKGITTYREGTMAAVLETKKSQENEEGPTRLAPRRRKRLECDIYHMTVRGERWNVFVGCMNDSPYEVFAGRSENIKLAKNLSKGVIAKEGGGYNLYTPKGKLLVEDLATVFDNSMESAFLRTISLSLRHGVPVQYVVEQVNKGADKENDMFSLARGLVRVLKKYIKNGSKPTTKACPSCGTIGSLVYQEGCELCTSCGYTVCG